MILETTFLVDLERERRGARVGAAHEFLRGHEDWSLCITDVVAGELAMGVSLGERPLWEEFVGPFRILPSTLEADWQYARAATYLERNGLAIGSNDLWIAAVALASDLPVVTRNLDHFRRVPGLRVVAY